jgi:hypothetical protein
VEGIRHDLTAASVYVVISLHETSLLKFMLPY